MFYPKSISLLLVICLIGSLMGGILIAPKKAQAEVLLVEIIGDVGDYLFDIFNLIENTFTAAVQAWDKAMKLATWYLGEAMYALVEGLLTQLTNDMVEWLNNGGEGLPRFLAMDFDDWIWDTANKASGIFIEQYLGAGWLCDSFYDQLNDMFKLKLEVPRFEKIDYDVDCTIEDVLDNAESSLEKFEQDFSEGDWDAWVEFTEKENNFFGAYMESVMAETGMRNEAEETQNKELAMNDGYQNHKNCTWYDASTTTPRTIVEEQKDIIGIPPIPEACNRDPNNPGMTVGGYKMPCYYECEILTPGSTVKDMSSKTVTNYWDQLNNQLNALLEKAGPFAVFIRSIAESLLNSFFEEDGGGLKHASSIPGSGSITPNPYTEGAELIAILEGIIPYLEKIIPEAQKNANEYQKIKNYYNNYTLPALQKIIDDCMNNSDESKWAQDKLDEINQEILPEIQKKIDRPKNLAIAKKNLELAISDLKIWLDDPQDDEIKEKIIQRAKRAMEIINDQSTASSFSELISESETAKENLKTLMKTIIGERDNSFPTSGSIPAEMELAKDIKDDADDKLDSCTEEEVF